MENESVNPMSENQNMPLMLSAIGLFLLVIGIVIASFGVTIPEQLTIQPFVGVVLTIIGIIVLISAFIRMRPKKPIGWRIKKPQIEP